MPDRPHVVSDQDTATLFDTDPGMLDAFIVNAEPSLFTVTAADCQCAPCPGRGNDGHRMTHCAECCFGTGVDADIDCPEHGI